MSTDPPKSSPSGLKAVEAAGDHVAYNESTTLEVDESKLVRKLDLHLIPLVMLLCESKLFLKCAVGLPAFYELPAFYD